MYLFPCSSSIIILSSKISILESSHHQNTSNMSSNEIPQGDAQDNDYVSRPGESDTIPVQSDNAKVEDPIDAETADSDAQLGKNSQILPTLLLHVHYGSIAYIPNRER